MPSNPKTFDDIIAQEQDSCYSPDAFASIKEAVEVRRQRGSLTNVLKKTFTEVYAERQNLIERHAKNRDALKAAKALDLPVIAPSKMRASLKSGSFDPSRNSSAISRLEKEIEEIEYQIAVNSKKTNFLFTEGGRFTEAELRNKLAVIRGDKKRLEKFASVLPKGIDQAISFLGRGPNSRISAANHPYYLEYQKSKAEEMRRLIDTGAGKNPSDRIAYLQRLRFELKNSASLIDKISFNEIDALLNEAIKKEQEFSANKDQEVDKALSSADSEAQKKIAELMGKEGDIWKWRLLQMMLIITPLGPISALGMLNPVTHFLGSLVGNLFDALFLSDLPISDRIASIASDEVAGVLAFFFDSWLPDVINWLLDNTPIVNTIFDAADLVLNNKVAHNAFVFAGDAIYSLMASSAISTFVAFHLTRQHVEKSFDLAIERGQVLDQCESEMKSKLAGAMKFHSTRSEYHIKQDLSSLVTRSFEAVEKSAYSIELAKFIVRHPTLHGLLGDSFPKSKSPENLQHVAEFISGMNPKPKSGDELKKIVTQIAEEVAKISLQERSIAVTSDSIAKEIKALKTKFVVEVAKELSSEDKSLKIEDVDEKKCSELREKIIQSRLGTMLAQAQNPSLNPSMTKGSPLDFTTIPSRPVALAA